MCDSVPRLIDTYGVSLITKRFRHRIAVTIDVGSYYCQNEPENYTESVPTVLLQLSAPF